MKWLKEVERLYRGKGHFIVPQQFHEQIMQMVEEPYNNWCIKASDLLHICEASDFPKQYSRDIKLAILNKYTMEVLHFIDIPTDVWNVPDRMAVYFCYNNLPEGDEEVQKAKENFLRQLILVAINEISLLDTFQIPNNYTEILENWKEMEFRKFFKEKQIHFPDFHQRLYEDFIYFMRALI